MPRVATCGFDAGGPMPPQFMLAIHGPTLVVDIGFDPTHVPGSSASINLGARGLPALVDTGAHECFVDSDLAISLKLPVVDIQTVSGSAGRHEVTMYLAHIHVPSLDVTINGRFGGVNLVAGGQRHSALIGRSFLMHFRMTYDGPSGAVELLLP